MKINHGWKVPPGRSLRITPSYDTLTSQFLLSFIETNLEGFLDTMTSDTLAQRSDLAKQICFAANEFVASINPFWATNYDIVTGCDLDHKSNNQYEIDTTCMTRQGLNCREEFPEYAHGLSQMPGVCEEESARGTVISRLNTGSLPPEITAPCDRSFESPEVCNKKHGTLFGATGLPVNSLHDRIEDHETVSGIWNADSLNKILTQTFKIQILSRLCD